MTLSPWDPHWELKPRSLSPGASTAPLPPPPQPASHLHTQHPVWPRPSHQLSGARGAQTLDAEVLASSMTLPQDTETPPPCAGLGPGLTVVQLAGLGGMGELEVVEVGVLLDWLKISSSM